ncbi:hypothetical protein JOL79_10670 [Microbispora sp. RL4-1S]|uniref:Uncharacterized protein n=1 Tax=Microbispora oryzae TaxID=2806554 RepID=A0A940WP33_9ACTN|nr:hypothetical protein [Microbispora oryzae]MBP2704274.1 hypothetical protein [Microbispora oryzae]
MSMMQSEPSTGATLPESWHAFAAKPDTSTAKAVAKELEVGTNPTRTLASVALIAQTLAKRSARERSAMSRLLATELGGDIALGFLRETAAVPLATQETPKKQAVPQHDDVRHRLDLLEPEVSEKLPEKTEGGRDWRTLDALDLAAAGKVTVDLVELAEHVDDVRDASSIGHLGEVLRLVNSIGRSDTSYSKTRRADVAKTVKVQGTTQEHIVEQIGFRAAQTQRADKGGLWAQNESAVTYWRTNFRSSAQKFVERLQVREKPGPGDRLVNSPRVLHKLRMILSEEELTKLAVRPLVGTSGVSVLSGTDKITSIDWDHVLRELGATPSAYQLYELIDAENTAPLPDYTVDTQADLIQLITCSPFSRLQEMARGKRELAPVCAMVEHLVLGLTDKLGPSRFDALTANALASLSRLIGIVVENEANPSVAMRAVDLMMDEIGIVVAVGKYYTWSDYRKTMRNVLLERAPSIRPLVEKERIELSSHLMTSGMDALGTAVYIALASRHHEDVARSTEEIDYYETGELLGKLKKGETASPRKDVLIAALNPSTPAVVPSAEGLASDVLKRLETYKKGEAPFALIVDSTIEVAPESPGGKTQLEVLLDRLKDAVADGRLEVFLCKSFQKYASFGTGKVAAGDLTMLSMKGNLESAYARSEALLQDLNLDFIRHDESQLVVHMLRHGHRDELELVRSAARNAKFVDEFCWPIGRSDLRQGTPYVEGIPLLMRSTPTGDVDELFKKLVTIDWRDSFSFLRTSYVGDIPRVGDVSGKFVRINTGHEPKESMVEYFYAFGHLATSTPPGATVPSETQVDLAALTVDRVREHLEALKLLRDEEHARIARYRNSIVASYCAFAAQIVKSTETVIPLIIGFFGQPAGRVTIETQRYLADVLISYMRGRTFDPEPATLTALYRAAVVLPGWRIRRIAGGLQLGGIGDSEEARRLRNFIASIRK